MPGTNKVSTDVAVFLADKKFIAVTERKSLRTATASYQCPFHLPTGTELSGISIFEDQGSDVCYTDIYSGLTIGLELVSSDGLSTPVPSCESYAARTCGNIFRIGDSIAADPVGRDWYGNGCIIAHMHENKPVWEVYTSGGDENTWIMCYPLDSPKEYPYFDIHEFSAPYDSQFCQQLNSHCNAGLEAFNPCPLHDVCKEGAPLLSSCGDCAAAIIVTDPYCGTYGWDKDCVSDVATHCPDVVCSI
jgi:hypothetical protein